MYILGVNIYFQRHGFTGKKKTNMLIYKNVGCGFFDETR